MVDQRRDKRAPASLKVKYKSANVDQFIEQFGTDVSPGGMFIKTKTPLEMGTLLKLELQLSDASPVIQGMGRVCWRRVNSTDPTMPAGMGLKFVKLEDQSRGTIERIVKKRGSKPSRFDQTQGAELSNDPEDAPESVPPAVSAGRATAASPASPAAPRAPAPGTSAAAPPRVSSPAAVAPAAAAAPARGAAARPAVAGLFAKSPLASQPPEPPPDNVARSSFFPPAPAAAPAPPSPAGPARTSPGRALGPAGAFGSTKAAPAAPAAPAPPPVRDDEEAAFDRLFDDVQRSAAAAPPAAAPPAAAPTAAAARARSSAPAAPPAPTAPPVTEMDDVFASLGEEEGLRSVPPIKPARRSTPDSAAEALAALAEPKRSSSPSRPSLPGLDLPMGDDDDDFGEADIGGGASAPPPARSLRPASIPSLALPPEQPEQPKRPLWPLIVLLFFVVGGIGGYVYYQRMLAAQALEQARLDAANAAAAAEAALEPAAAAVEPAAMAGAGSVAVAGAGAAAGAAAAATGGVAAAAPAAPSPAPSAAPSAAPTAPTAPAAPAAPAVPVQVEVTSVPRGADVFVSGARIGMSPLRVELPIGQATDVMVKSQGFAAETLSVTAVAGQEPLRFKLEPLDYLLFVRTEPPEAELEIGAKTAVAPGPLALGHLDGAVLVTVSKVGHQRMSRPVRLEEFSEADGKMRAEIDVRLSPLPGYKVPVVKPPPPVKPPARIKAGARKPAAAAPAPPSPAAEPGSAAPPAPSAAPATLTPPPPSGPTLTLTPAPAPAPTPVPTPPSAPSAPVP